MRSTALPYLFRTRVSLLELMALLILGGVGCESEEDAELAASGSAELTASAEVTATAAGMVATATAVVPSVEVRLTDFGVTAEPGSVQSGAIAFLVRNDGAIPHEFVVVATDLTPGELPQKDQKTVDETVVEVVSRIEAFDSGTRRDATVTLESGRYVLLCNIPSHYISGMFTDVVVR